MRRGRGSRCGPGRAMSTSEPSTGEPPLAAPLLRHQVPFAELTTFGVGGPARHLARCEDTPGLRRALRWAREEGLPVFVLGGGSNLLVAENGFPGLALMPAGQELKIRGDGDEVLVEAEAGVPWDRAVAAAVEAGGAGLEALSGIPGHAGAAPIQNIGAYGQELAQSLEKIALLDRETLDEREVTAAECGFAYRTSRFKEDWAGRFVITRLHFRLARQERAAVAYPELRRHLGLEPDEPARLADLRRAVLELRRGKSMLADPADPNGRSAGSFFLNPVVAPEAAAAVERRYRERGGGRDMPRWPAGDGIKLSAAWLIEEAGFPKGYGTGRAGLSARHTLALVNRGGATAAEVLALAREVREGVRVAFGVLLRPEPILLGFAAEELP